MGQKRVSFHTLGCKLNFSETSTIAREFERGGYIRVEPSEPTDVAVINSCSVTEHADKKCRNIIRKIHRRNPNAIIAVTGCYAQLKPRDIAAIEGVDVVLGNNDKGDLYRRVAELQEHTEAEVYRCSYDQISRFFAAYSSGDRTRSFLKVQDGCDYYCTYCTIPLARGRSRSGRIEDLVEQARQVAAEGGKEIVLTGVNIGDFGKGRDDNFFDLIRALDEVEGIERYRISSIEPNLLSEEIIRWVATESKRFMPHFHIPLQSGSDEVLRLMHRHYDTALFRERIEMIKREIPHAFIGVDVIAGARGETDEEWQKSYDFIASLDITQLHVFPYSERPNTKALNIGHVVSQAEKHRRVAELMKLSEERLEAFVAKSIGECRPVLWEQPSKGKPMHGFTDNYLRVEADYDESLINTITSTDLVCVDGENIIGKVVSANE